MSNLQWRHGMPLPLLCSCFLPLEELLTDFSKVGERIGEILQEALGN